MKSFSDSLLEDLMKDTTKETLIKNCIVLTNAVIRLEQRIKTIEEKLPAIENCSQQAVCTNL